VHVVYMEMIPFLPHIRNHCCCYFIFSRTSPHKQDEPLDLRKLQVHCMNNTRFLFCRTFLHLFSGFVTLTHIVLLLLLSFCDAGSLLLLLLLLSFIKKETKTRLGMLLNGISAFLLCLFSSSYSPLFHLILFCSNSFSLLRITHSIVSHLLTNKAKEKRVMFTSL
jgi:hypothetical protein